MFGLSDEVYEELLFVAKCEKEHGRYLLTWERAMAFGFSMYLTVANRWVVLDAARNEVYNDNAPDLCRRALVGIVVDSDAVIAEEAEGEPTKANPVIPEGWPPASTAIETGYDAHFSLRPPANEDLQEALRVLDALQGVISVRGSSTTVVQEYVSRVRVLVVRAGDL